MAAVTQVRILVTAVTFSKMILKYDLNIILSLAKLCKPTLVDNKRQWYSGEHSCLPSS